MAALAAAYPSAALLTPMFNLQDDAQVETAIRETVPDVCIHLAAVSAIASPLTDDAETRERLTVLIESYL